MEKITTFFENFANDQIKLFKINNIVKDCVNYFREINKENIDYQNSIKVTIVHKRAIKKIITYKLVSLVYLFLGINIITLVITNFLINIIRIIKLEFYLNIGQMGSIIIITFGSACLLIFGMYLISFYKAITPNLILLKEIKVRIRNLLSKPDLKDLSMNNLMYCFASSSTVKQLKDVEYEKDLISQIESHFNKNIEDFMKNIVDVDSIKPYIYLALKAIKNANYDNTYVMKIGSILFEMGLIKIEISPIEEKNMTKSEIWRKKRKLFELIIDENISNDMDYIFDNSFRRHRSVYGDSYLKEKNLIIDDFISLSLFEGAKHIETTWIKTKTEEMKYSAEKIKKISSNTDKTD